MIRQVRTGNSHVNITKQINTDTLITNSLLVNNVSLPNLEVKLWLSFIFYLVITLIVQLFTCTLPVTTIPSYYTITKFSNLITYQQFKEDSLYTKSLT